MAGLMDYLWQEAQREKGRGLMSHMTSGPGVQREVVERSAMLPFGKDQYGGAMFAMPGAVRDVLSGIQAIGTQSPMEYGESGMLQPSQQGIEHAANVAGGLTLGNAPVAASRGLMAGDNAVLGIFGGPGARTANLPALKRAEELAATGADRSTILNETGWFRGPDDKWRFEIDDSGRVVDIPGAAKRRDDEAFKNAEIIETASIIKNRAEKRGISIEDAARSVQDQMGRDVSESAMALARSPISGADLAKKAGEAWPIDAYAEPFRLGEVVSHPELFAAYPDLARRPLQVGQKGLAQFRAAYLPDEDSFALQKYMDRDQEYSVGHEMQHRIQETEGFAPGGNQSTTVYKEVAPIEKEIEKLSKSGAYDGFDAWRNSPEVRKQSLSYNQEVNKYLELHPEDEQYKRVAELSTQRDSLMSRGGKEYMRLGGEVESRNVQTRRDMTKEERRRKAPWETQDVPDAEQILIRRGK